jgi:hypothetical protein
MRSFQHPIRACHAICLPSVLGKHYLSLWQESPNSCLGQVNLHDLTQSLLAQQPSLTHCPNELAVYTILFYRLSVLLALSQCIIMLCNNGTWHIDA